MEKYNYLLAAFYLLGITVIILSILFTYAKIDDIPRIK
jgi:hypothetical protein